MAATPYVTLFPGTRTAVRLPYDPNESGYEVLEDVLGLSRRGAVKYERDNKVFTVSRSHNRTLIRGLALRYGMVTVTQYGNTTEMCVENCWNAKRETWPDCSCVCNGSNHGSRQPYRHLVGDGDLSVENTPTEHTRTVTAADVRAEGLI